MPALDLDQLQSELLYHRRLAVARHHRPDLLKAIELRIRNIHDT
jgi:hypothetical protein